MTEANKGGQNSNACNWLSLDQVLITQELASRPTRPPNLEAERRALQTLADVSGTDPKKILNTFVDLVLEVLQADSAGVSVLEETPGNERFIWPAIAGKFAKNIGNGMSRWASPCGTVLDQNRPLLFQHPELHFPYVVLVDPPIIEALLAPFHLDGRPVGTVWVIAHNHSRKFDAEDARLLTKLTEFASIQVELLRECIAT